MIPFDGGPAEQVVRTQEVQVLPPAPSSRGPDGPDQWRVLAPVTERGEVIGLLEFLVPEEPAPRLVDESPSSRTCWRSWSSPTGGTPICTSGANAPGR